MNWDYRARLSIVDSHKSTGNGPVRSPVCNPSKKPKTQNKTQKQQQTKQKTNQLKEHQELGLQPAIGIHA